MKKICLTTVITVCWMIIFSGIQGQTSRLDSIIFSKNLNFSEGMVPTYYSVGCEDRAKEMQSL